MKKKSNAERAFLDNLLKRNNGKISVLVYRKPTRTDQCLHCSPHPQTSCQESVASSLLNRTHYIITNKDGLNKESTKGDIVLKENGCQESIISKMFNSITNNHSLSQSQKQT